MYSACKCSNMDFYKLRLSLLYEGAECIYRISEHKALCLHTCLDTVTLLCGNETPRVVCLHSAARLHVECRPVFWGTVLTMPDWIRAFKITGPNE